MAQIPIGLISHSRKVCSLYKRVLRHLESEFHLLDKVRYESVLMRARFDKNKNIKDMRLAKHLLQQGEAELKENELPSYKQFANSPGGTAYDREPVIADWVLDYWDPIEKAMYPKYFALREKRKLEYEKFYEKQYGKPLNDNNH